MSYEPPTGPQNPPAGWPPQPPQGWQQQPVSGPPPGPPKRRRHTARNVTIGLLSGLALLIVIVAVAAGGKTPSSNAGVPAVQVTDSDGGVCSSAAVGTNGYCPGDTPSAPAAAAPAAPAASPVTVSGSGETVVTASGLVPGVTYTLSYTASGSSTNALIVDEVEAGGTTNNLVNDIGGFDDSTALTGSTIATADASTETLKISNDDGESWSLTFTPLES